MIKSLTPVDFDTPANVQSAEFRVAGILAGDDAHGQTAIGFIFEHDLAHGGPVMRSYHSSLQEIGVLVAGLLAALADAGDPKAAAALGVLTDA